MTRIAAGVCAGPILAGLALASGALAQTTEVVVRGERPQPAERTDRSSLTVAPDAAGVALDVLRGLPLLAVSADGRVTLRGLAVVVLIDGERPADGEAALRSLAAADIQRVEILTQPSLQYGTQGPAINIILRKVRIGVSGDLHAEATSQGQANIALSGTMAGGGWTFDGRFLLDHYQSRSALYVDQAIPQPDALAVTRRIDRTHYNSDNATISLSAGYGLSATDEITVTAEHGHFVSASDGDTTSRGAEQFDETSLIKTGNRNSRLKAVYARNTGQAQLRITYDHEQVARAFAASYDRPEGGYTTLNSRDTAADRLEADYERRFGSHRLSMGGAIDRTESRIVSGFISRNAPVAALDGDGVFTGAETVSSAYATWQAPVGDWTVLPGLRVERQRLDLPQRARIDHTDWLPSLHIDRDVGETGRLKFSYLKRVDQPQLSDYDDTPLHLGAYLVSAGNPDLQPQVTDSWEVGYSRDGVRLSAGATLYMRETRGDIEAVTRATSSGFLVRNAINTGLSRAGGVEFYLRGTVFERFSYSVNGNLAYAEVPYDAAEGVVVRGRLNVSGNGIVDYEARGGDRYQLSVNAYGRTLDYQGYTEGFYSVDFRWTRPVSRRLSIVTTITDVFDSSGYTSVIDTADLYLVSRSVPSNRALKLALTWRLGAF